MFTYDVFLSHSSADRRAVEALARKLRDEEGLKVFFVEGELVSDTGGLIALEDALATSRACLICLGPEGLGSWHSDEMRVALGQRVRAEPHRILSVLLPDADASSESPFLLQLTWDDLRAGSKDTPAFRRLVLRIQGVLEVSADGSEASPARAKVGRQGRIGKEAAADEPKGLIRGFLWLWLYAESFVVVLVVAGAGLLLWSPWTAPFPEAYQLQVEVFDPGGLPVEGATLWITLEDKARWISGDWYRVPIARSRVPKDGLIKVRAEHAPWQSGQTALQLGRDPNPRVQVRLRERGAT